MAMRYTITLNNPQTTIGWIEVNHYGLPGGSVWDTSPFWHKMRGNHIRGVMARFIERGATIEPPFNPDDYPAEVRPDRASGLNDEV